MMLLEVHWKQGLVGFHKEVCISNIPPESLSYDELLYSVHRNFTPLLLIANGTWMCLLGIDILFGCVDKYVFQMTVASVMQGSICRSCCLVVQEW